MPDINYVSSKPLPENLSDIADAIRSKTGNSGIIHTDEMAGQINTLSAPLPSLTNPATASEIANGYEAINGQGQKITGSFIINDIISDFYATHRVTVTVGENNVALASDAYTYLIELAGITGTVDLVGIIIREKSSYVYNEIGALVVYRGTLSSATSYGSRYRSGWSSIAATSQYIAALVEGTVYDVFYSERKGSIWVL